MRIVGVQEFGGPQVLEALTVPRPVPGPGQVLVRVHGAAVNPTDTLNRAGINRRWAEGRPTPWIAGMDFAGVVVELGAETSGRLSISDAVVGITCPTLGEPGAYAEYVVVDERSVVTAPSRVDLITASTLIMNGLTALLSIRLMEARPGDWIAVTGAAGTMGGYAVQLAKYAGLHVIADASEQDAVWVKSLGADIVVPRGPEVAKRILEHVPDGVTGLLDGSNQREAVLSAVHRDGILVIVRPWNSETVEHPRVVLVIATDGSKDTEAMTQLVKLVDDQALTLRVADVLPPDQAPLAHERLEGGGVRGRLVLDFRN